ncbi:MAG TPA: choice-of-anchor D domain-containing protein, partial [Bryobacterales bacterium]|nr:choice-of-anchor D domain-containing protein [Bryobacterales bacterium]
TIGSGASCTVGVTFSPATGGVINGTLTFTDSAANSPQTVSLTGTGSTVATASPTSLSFGQVRVGHASSAKTVTLTNTGGASLTFSSITASASYSISSNTCGASLAAGANCTVGVTFTPAVKGTINGTLKFVDSALNSPQTVSLAGAGK